MALFDRLLDSNNRVRAHDLFALLPEWEAGEINRATVEAFLELDVGDPDLTVLVNLHQASANKPVFESRVHGIVILAQRGLTGYSTREELEAVIQRIG